MDSRALLEAVLLLAKDCELVLHVDGKNVVSIDIDQKHPGPTEPDDLVVNLRTSQNR